MLLLFYLDVVLVFQTTTSSTACYFSLWTPFCQTLYGVVIGTTNNKQCHYSLASLALVSIAAISAVLVFVGGRTVAIVTITTDTPGFLFFVGRRTLAIATTMALFSIRVIFCWTSYGCHRNHCYHSPLQLDIVVAIATAGVIFL